MTRSGARNSLKQSSKPFGSSLNYIVSYGDPMQLNETHFSFYKCKLKSITRSGARNPLKQSSKAI